MSDTNVPAIDVELKELDDINLKALAADIAEVFGKHVGGRFEIAVSSLEHTHHGFTDNQMFMRFHITDKSWSERFVRHRMNRHSDEIFPTTPS
jgi:hypothetical protein